MSWDEAAIGYNGFAIWTTRRDEWLFRLPVSFMSFGDYKAPLAIYLNGFFTTSLGLVPLSKFVPFIQPLADTVCNIFTLNLWTVRFPFALASVLTVIGCYFFMKHVIRFFLAEQTPTSLYPVSYRQTLLLTTMLASFSPWLFHFSRAGFESGLAICCLIWSAVFFFKQCSSSHTFFKRSALLITSAVLACMSMYAYHSAKIVVPLLFLLFIILFFKKLRQTPKEFLLALCVAILVLLPMGYDTLKGKGGERFSQTSVLSDPTLTIIKKVELIGKNYAAQFNPRFLIFGQTTTLRHSDGKWGVLFPTELVLFVSLAALIVRKPELKRKRLLVFALFWILIGLSPASIGNEIPHANRALLAYPGFLLLEAYAIYTITQTFFQIRDKKQQTIARSMLGMWVLLHVLCIVSYMNHYFSNYALESASAFNYGYQQVFEYVIPMEKDVDKIVFTNSYGQAYVYALFFKKMNPIWYHGGSLAQYQFVDKVTIGDFVRKNTLLIATPEEVNPAVADKLILAPDGSVRFVIVRTDI